MAGIHPEMEYIWSVVIGRYLHKLVVHRALDDRVQGELKRVVLESIRDQKRGVWNRRMLRGGPISMPYVFVLANCTTMYHDLHEQAKAIQQFLGARKCEQWYADECATPSEAFRFHLECDNAQVVINWCSPSTQGGTTFPIIKLWTIARKAPNLPRYRSDVANGRS